MLLQGPVCETALCRGPCLDTHQPTHPQPHITIHPHMHRHTPTTILQLQSDVNSMIYLTSWSVSLPSLLGQNQTSQLSVLRRLFYSYISHCLLSSSLFGELSHSHLSLLASTCFEFDTCLPTPTRHQQKSQQVTVNSVQT